jgi:hypothetical protein
MGPVNRCSYDGRLKTNLSTSGEFCTLSFCLSRSLCNVGHTSARDITEIGMCKLTTMTGIPISFKSRRHSSLCAFVGLTCLLASLSISSTVPDHDIWNLRSDGSRTERKGKVLPVSLASSSASAAALRAANRLASCMTMHTALDMLKERGTSWGCTHDTTFQLGRFTIKHIRRLDAVIHHSQSSPEEAHEMTVGRERVRRQV